MLEIADSLVLQVLSEDSHITVPPVEFRGGGESHVPRNFYLAISFLFAKRLGLSWLDAISRPTTGGSRGRP